MFRVEGLHPDQKGSVVQYTQLSHGQDEEHDKQVIQLVTELCVTELLYMLY